MLQQAAHCWALKWCRLINVMTGCEVTALRTPGGDAAWEETVGGERRREGGPRRQRSVIAQVGQARACCRADTGAREGGRAQPLHARGVVFVHQRCQPDTRAHLHAATQPRGPCFGLLLPDQLVLLLETLLEEKTLCPRTLQRLQKLYSLREQDAEVRHRWCELVVKHKYTAAYGDLETFLREDQAMGVYLYGELMVNEDAKQQELARRCFAAVQDEMDASTLRVVQEMLF